MIFVNRFLISTAYQFCPVRDIRQEPDNLLLGYCGHPLSRIIVFYKSYRAVRILIFAERRRF
jgi:hypothetical protein